MARKSETKPAAQEKKRGRKKNADGTKKPGRFKQMIEVFKYTQGIDKSTAPLMILAMLLSIAGGVAISWLVLNSPWYGIFLGLAVGLLVAMLILALWAYRRDEGRRFC